MAIKRVGEVTTATNANSDKSEYDKWAALSQVKMVDDKLNARAGFRNSVGMSQSEYKKQVEEAKKQGFGAMLKEEMKKHI